MKKQTGDYQCYKCELDHAIVIALDSWPETRLRKNIQSAMFDLCHYEDLRIENDPAWVPDDESSSLKRFAMKLLDMHEKPTNEIMHEFLTLEERYAR